jgi:hypothetical protein
MNNPLFISWLWFIGSICIFLPYVWWPRALDQKSALHLFIFFSLLAVVIRAKLKGGIFDAKRDIWRGKLGVIFFAVVLFGSAFAYRTFLIGQKG